MTTRQESRKRESDEAIETVATGSETVETDELSIPKEALPQPWPPSVSVVVPTFNEADNLDELVARCEDALQKYPYEIIIVDDDSPDNTWRLASLLYEDNPQVRIIRRTNNKGLATAVTRGISESNHEFCTVMDADLQHPPEEIPRLLNHIDPDVDLVIGSRYTDFGNIEDWSLFRRLVSRCAVDFAKACLPSVRQINDPMSGFFVVRRSLLGETELSPSGYKILLEILVRCDVDKIVEVPYTFQERSRGDSKLTAGEYVEFLKHVGKLRGVIE